MNGNKIILLVSILIVLSLINGCTLTENCENPSTYIIKDGKLMLDKEGTIPCTLCEERGLDDRIVVLESEYCGACKAVVPVIKEVAKELNTIVTFLDLSESEDQNKMSQLGVMPYYTPTMLVGCQVYVGGKTKSEYKSIISKFVNK